MYLYIAHPEYAPNNEAELIPAKDDDQAREYAAMTLSTDQVIGYSSPRVTLYRVPGIELDTIGTLHRDDLDSAGNLLAPCLVNAECPVPDEVASRAHAGHPTVWGCKGCHSV